MPSARRRPGRGHLRHRPEDSLEDGVRREAIVCKPDNVVDRTILDRVRTVRQDRIAVAHRPYLLAAAGAAGIDRGADERFP